MWNTLIVWVVKQIASYAIGKLAKCLGVDEATNHVTNMLTKYTPLIPDPNPSPAAERNKTSKLYGG